MVWLCAGIVLILFVLVLSYACYNLTFSVPEKNSEDVYYLPRTEQYLPYEKEIRKMIDEAASIDYEKVYVTSFDNLSLCAKLYFSDDNADWLIMFHGYRSSAERDFCGGLKFGIDFGFNVLLVDQRAHNDSEGKCLTFGINERKDCLSWIDYVVKRSGENSKIVLYGMSMGASTVLMAADLGIEKNVAGIIADCGYTCAEDIIKTVIKRKHYPVFLTYALIKLGAKIWGKFDIEETSVLKAVKKCEIPVLFIHGGDDCFVPCEMGKENFECCRSAKKEILIIPGAGHGMSYMKDKEAYLEAVSDFLKKVLSH